MLPIIDDISISQNLNQNNFLEQNFKDENQRKIQPSSAKIFSSTSSFCSSSTFLTTISSCPSLSSHSSSFFHSFLSTQTNSQLSSLDSKNISEIKFSQTEPISFIPIPSQFFSNQPNPSNSNSSQTYSSFSSSYSLSSDFFSSSSPQSFSSHSPFTSHSPKPLMLPPCRICSEKASGFHYGVNTCEACKGFFRRCIQRKHPYKCQWKGACPIKPGRRSRCAGCRYQKCLFVGMSREAIKTGRYTHEKKTKNIQEVKRLEKEKIKKQEKNLTHSNDPKKKIENFNQENIPKDQNKTRKMSLCTSDEEEEEEEEDRDVIKIYDENISNKVMEKIMKIHNEQTPHTPEFFKNLPLKEKDFLTKRSLQLQVFGPLRPITYQEYSNIYQTTGIDVDGRKEMLEHMIVCIENAIKRFITFAKSVPGFKQFSIDDQIKLIKSSRFEAWLISAYKAFNPDHNIYTHFCGSTVHLDEMAKLYDSEFLHEVFRVVKMIKKLNLSEEEDCLIKAIAVLFRDRVKLKDPNKVEQTQLLMVLALQEHHLKNKPRDKLFIARIISLLTELRNLTDVHTEQEAKINMEWSSDVKIPPLLYEIFSA